MPLKTLGYATQSATADLAPFSFERCDPRPDDVVIDILYCGVCHSDLHTARNDWGWTTFPWGWTTFPIVPGHEIIGRVRDVGAQVTRFKAGDAVGVGCMVDSCRHCKPCETGEEQYCKEGSTFTYGGQDRHDHTKTQGGYSNQIVVSDRFVLKARSSPAATSSWMAASRPPIGMATWPQHDPGLAHSQTWNNETSPRHALFLGGSR